MPAPKLMLAPNEQIDFGDSRIPTVTLCSDKLDGMRVLALDGVLYSRNLKPLRSEIQERWQDFLLIAKKHAWVFDGEIFEYGNPNFGSLMSKITKGGSDVPDSLGIHVFDAVPLKEWGSKLTGALSYKTRVQMCKHILESWEVAISSNVIPMPQFECASPAQLEAAFDAALSRGTEGLIARDPLGKYKHGRGTLNEGLIFKFKEWVTQDGVITGFNQGTKMKEDVRLGERTIDAFGHREISHKKDTRELCNLIGSYEVTLTDGRVIGAGLKKGLDLTWGPQDWESRNRYLNLSVEVEYMEHGTKSLPRFSRITRRRPDLDL